MLKRVEFHASETTRSFLSRTAAVNGASDMRSMVKHLGGNLKAVLAGSRPACEKLSAELHVPADRLVFGCKVITKGRLSTINEHVLEGSSFHSGALRFCPHCVADDLLKRQGDVLGRSFERLSWMVSDIGICSIHELALASSPENAGTINHDFVRCVSSRLKVVEAAIENAERATVSPAERYFAERLDQAPAGTSYLDKFPYFGARNLSLYVGSLKTFGASASVRFLDKHAARETLETGFEILAGGEPNFHAFVTDVAKHYWKTAAWHPAATIFGNLYHYLQGRAKHGDHQEVIALLRDVVVDVLPLGPEDNFFGPLEHRRLHTVATAARQYGIPRTEVRALLTQEGVIDQSHRFKSDAEIVFKADVMGRRFQDRGDLVTMRRLIESTRAGDFKYECFFDQNWRYALHPKENVPGRLPRYSIAEASDLLARMTSRAENFSGPDMVSLRDAARLATCSFTRLCTMLVEGQLSRVFYDERQRFAGIKVSYKELREAIHGQYRGDFHIEDAAELFEISVPSARALMLDGTLPAEVIAGLGYNAPRLVMSREVAMSLAKANVAVEKLAADAGVRPSRVIDDQLRSGRLPSIVSRSGMAVFFPRR